MGETPPPPPPSPDARPSPESLRETLRAALDHHRAGRLPEAEGLYRLVLAHAPQNADAWNLLGVCLQQRGKTGEGTDLIERAIALNPAAAEYHYNLAAALESLQDWPGAIAGYRRALERKPDYADARHNLEIALRRQASLAAAAGPAAATPSAAWPAPGGKAFGVLLRCTGDKVASIRAIKSLTHDAADLTRCDIHVVADGASPATIAALRGDYDAGRLTTLMEFAADVLGDRDDGSHDGDRSALLVVGLEVVRTTYLLLLSEEREARPGWAAAVVNFIERHHPFDEATDAAGGLRLARADLRAAKGTGGRDTGLCCPPR